jgi:hypothetical protein
MRCYSQSIRDQLWTVRGRQADGVAVKNRLDAQGEMQAWHADALQGEDGLPAVMSRSERATLIGGRSASAVSVMRQRGQQGLEGDGMAQRAAQELRSEGMALLGAAVGSCSGERRGGESCGVVRCRVASVPPAERWWISGQRKGSVQ